jgi:hypothetical protein
MSTPIKKQVVFYFEKRLSDCLREEATLENRSMNGQLTHILKQYYAGQLIPTPTVDSIASAIEAARREG